MSTDFILIAGNTVTIGIVIIDQETSQPLDLTAGAEVRFKMGTPITVAEGSMAIIYDNASHGHLVIDPSSPPTGLAVVTVQPRDTVNLAGTFFYEFDVIQADGVVSTVKAGNCVVEQSLLRAEDLP